MGRIEDGDKGKSHGNSNLDASHNSQQQQQRGTLDTSNNHNSYSSSASRRRHRIDDTSDDEQTQQELLEIMAQQQQLQLQQDAAASSQTTDGRTVAPEPPLPNRRSTKIPITESTAARRRSTALLKASLEAFDDDLEQTKAEMRRKEAELMAAKKCRQPTSNAGTPTGSLDNDDEGLLAVKQAASTFHPDESRVSGNAGTALLSLETTAIGETSESIEQANNQNNLRQEERRETESKHGAAYPTAREYRISDAAMYAKEITEGNEATNNTNNSNANQNQHQRRQNMGEIFRQAREFAKSNHPDADEDYNSSEMSPPPSMPASTNNLNTTSTAVPDGPMAQMAHNISQPQQPAMDSEPDDPLLVAMMPTTLSRQSGRETLPQTQPGAVSVGPISHFANDTISEEEDQVGSEPNNNVNALNSGDDYDDNDDDDGSSEMDGSDDSTPEITDQEWQGLPEALPIRASIVRQEEESQQELEALQRQMEAKQAEMAAMQRKLADMERMQQELEQLKRGVAVAEPVTASSGNGQSMVSSGNPFASSSTGANRTGLAHSSKERAKESSTSRKKSRDGRPPAMSSAEFHAYQILIGDKTESSDKGKAKSAQKETNSNWGRKWSNGQRRDTTEAMGDESPIVSTSSTNMPGHSRNSADGVGCIRQNRGEIADSPSDARPDTVGVGVVPAPPFHANKSTDREVKPANNQSQTNANRGTTAAAALMSNTSRQGEAPLEESTCCLIL